MKKILIIIVCFLILAAAPVFTFAEEASAPEEPAPAPDENPNPPVTFSIDNENVYEGMSSAYKNGYSPVISDGNATIVIPLLPSGPVAGNILTASLDLGSATASPFSFQSYEKSFQFVNCPVNDNTGVVTAFPVRFDIPLSAERLNGSYPITVNVKATSAAGEPIEQAFTVFINISDGKKNENAVAKPTSQPILLVTGCNINPSPVNAGSEFTAEITIKNMSEKKHVYNMTVTLTGDPQLELLDEASTTYYKQLKKNESITVTARYKTDLETPAGRYDINVAMSYDNSEATTLSSSGVVSVNVKQPLSVELTMPKIANEVNAGDTLSLSMQVMNLSRTTAYNVRAELEAPGLIPNGTGFIGNMEAGTAAAANMNVFVGTKDMSEGYEGEKYGYTSGKITLVYEDSDGNENRLDYDIDTTINAPVIVSSAEPEDEEEKQQTQWWFAVIIAGVTVIGIAAWVAVTVKRKKQFNDEDT